MSQGCQYTSPTVVHGVSFLGGLAGYLDVYRRPAACEVSKNLRERSQADGDLWHGLFDTRAGPMARVYRPSKKRAVSVHTISFEIGIFLLRRARQGASEALARVGGVDRLLPSLRRAITDRYRFFTDCLSARPDVRGGAP